MNTTLVHKVKTKFNFSGSSIKVSDLENASVRCRKSSRFPAPGKSQKVSKLYILNCHFDILTI